MTMIQTGRVRYEVRLFGPLRGRTMLINSHRFVDGVAVLTGQPAALQFALVYFSRYQAYARGSQEYDAALALEEKAEHGDRNPREAGPEPESTDRVRGDHDATGEGSPRVQSPVVERDAGGPAGREGLRPEGNGYEDSGLRGDTSIPAIDETLRTVISSLDPNVSGHWTQAGLPSVTSIARAAKREDITRADINAAVPDWNRDKARELADLA